MYMHPYAHLPYTHTLVGGGIYLPPSALGKSYCGHKFTIKGYHTSKIHYHRLEKQRPILCVCVRVESLAYPQRI